MADLERRLGQELRRRAGSYDPSPDLPARIGQRTRDRAAQQRGRRRAAGWVAGGLAAAVVLVGLPLTFGGSGDDDASSFEAAAPSSSVLADAAAVSVPAAGRVETADDVSSGGAAATTAAATSGEAASRPTPTTAGATAGATTTRASGGATTMAAGAGAADDEDAGAPPFVLAFPPPRGPLTVIDTATGAPVGNVGRGTDRPPQFSADGDEVYELDPSPGCGSTITAYGSDGALRASDPDWVDLTAITSADDRSTVATVRAVGCDGGLADGYELTVAGPIDRTWPIAEVQGLDLDPSGTSLVVATVDGLLVVDLTDPAAVPEPLALPVPGCFPVFPTFRTSGVVSAVASCRDEAPALYQWDLATPGPPSTTALPVPGVQRVFDLDWDASGEHLLITAIAERPVPVAYSVGADLVARPVADAFAARWSGSD